MVKSVFISSTSKDLNDYRKAVDASIRRLGLNPINMSHFGSQPGGAVIVSLREVRKADIFVGIIARRYGYVPRGMSKSVTEQEYDEAVQRKIPRLMYVLNPNAYWNENLIEKDATAQERLAAFMERVEQNEVRSLFTGREDLARQVTADIANLLELQRRQSKRTRLWALITGLVLILFVVGAAFLLVPNLRGEIIKFLEFRCCLQSGVPFTGEVFGVVLADFGTSGSADANAELGIELGFEKAGMKNLLIRLPYSIRSREEAQRVSNLYDASLVIWGESFSGLTNGVVVSYEYTPQRGGLVVTRRSAEMIPATIESFDTYILEGTDALYVVDFTLGQLAYFERDFENAITAFRRAIRSFEDIPTDLHEDTEAEELFFYTGTSYYSINEYQQALENYSRALEVDPEYVLAYNNRGVAQADLKAYSEAIADYNKAIELNPNFGIAYNNRCRAYNAVKDNEKALVDCNRALELEPDEAVIYTSRGIVYADLGDYQRALDDLDESLGKDPEYAFGFNSRGSVKFDLGLYDDALEDFEKAIELDPNYASAYGNRGIVFYALGESEKALADYNQAIALDAKLATLYYNRGIYYQDRDDLNKALADYNQAIELDSSYSFAYNNRGNIYLKRDDYDRAFADYNQAIQEDPLNAIAYSNRGVVHRERNEDDLALVDYNQAIELDPDYATAYNNRGNLYLSRDEYDQALRDYNKAIELNPIYANAYWGRGDLNYELENYDEALNDYQEYERLAGKLEPHMETRIDEINELPESE